jgi:hypothetical protein
MSDLISGRVLKSVWLREASASAAERFGSVAQRGASAEEAGGCFGSIVHRLQGTSAVTTVLAEELGFGQATQ